MLTNYIGYAPDLGQAENRIVAYIAPDSLMQRAFEHGIDIHSQTAGLLFNKSIEEVSNEQGSSPIGSGERSERYWGKTANHSLNYNFGYRSFAVKFEIPEKDAKTIVNKYRTVYSGIQSYWKRIQYQLGQDRILTNLMGRKRKFMDRWGDQLFKHAYAFIPQSTVGDMINRRGIIPLFYDKDRYDCVHLLNQIHDEIVYQIHIEHGYRKHAEVLLSLKNEMEEPLMYLGKEFSIPFDFKLFLCQGKKEEPAISKDDPVSVVADIIEHTHKILLEKHEEEIDLQEYEEDIIDDGDLE